MSLKIDSLVPPTSIVAPQTFLSAKKKMNINKTLAEIGVKIILSLNEEERKNCNHLSNGWLLLAQFKICPYLLLEEQNNLHRTEKAWVPFTRFLFDLRFNNIFKEHVKPGKSLSYEDEENVFMSGEVIQTLGNGGSKQAYDIGEGRALLLPNQIKLRGGIDRITKWWKKTVDKEVFVSQQLTKMGILSPQSERVKLFLRTGKLGIESIPAYVSISFSHLASQGVYVIDTKNRNTSSTWKKGENFLFSSDQERLKDANWDSVFDSLITDVAKLCVCHFDAGGDSLSIAIVKKSSKSTLAQHEVRYFGFDFYDAQYQALLNPNANKSPDTKYAKWVLNKIIDWVLFHEFAERYDEGAESEKLIAFKDKLVERYTKDLLSRIAAQK